MNRLQGKVIQITAENGLIRIVIDAGILIAVLMRRQEYNQIRPVVGESVPLTIPPEAVDVF